MRITADYDPPEGEAALHDACVTIPVLEASGVVSADSIWNGLIFVRVRFEDLGFSSWQLQGAAKMLEASPSNQALLVEMLLRHQVPFLEFVTFLSAEVWSRAVTSGNSDEIEVSISEEAIDFCFHAFRMAKSFQEEMMKAAAEGEE